MPSSSTPDSDAPATPQTHLPWAGSRGEFIVVTLPCGCPVKVRDEAAAERMLAAGCKKHATLPERS